MVPTFCGMLRICLDFGEHIHRILYGRHNNSQEIRDYRVGIHMESLLGEPEQWTFCETEVNVVNLKTMLHVGSTLFLVRWQCPGGC